MSDDPMIRPVRRLGSNVTHFARIGMGMTAPASVLGRPCTALFSPVVTICGAMLRGDVVVMREYKPCSKCKRLAGLHDIDLGAGVT